VVPVTRRIKARCHDCQLDTLNMPGHSDYYLTEYFMVHGDVWAQAGMASGGGFLCVGCLQTRLHRPLTGDDLTDCETNQPGGCDTPRLYALKVAAEVARFRRAPRRAGP
jgi:hypothetical protein